MVEVKVAEIAALALSLGVIGFKTHGHVAWAIGSMPFNS